MAKLIQDIWIMADSGIVLFHRVFSQQIDAQLFGGLMTALSVFAEQLSKGGLTNFELSDKRFSVIKRNDLLFIANSSKNQKPKKVAQELDVITERFFELYNDDFMAHFNGNIKQFEAFEREIENSLEETKRKFQKAFW
ncbi:hypothetical protein LCGC14_1386210 [marine sediment metagenome]|uniref:Uncharacterized protein n=1 Tax=marine sediment metagenome TaxID=412755 RepID=A0A0F9N2U7_9ZZZZ|nr:MAG: hypothetical protein Lokiarch_01670 [Candidatus Lokiarchaeum sp. GC14_75]HEA70434.1 hypothetical protein [archaeon]